MNNIDYEVSYKRALLDNSEIILQSKMANGSCILIIRKLLRHKENREINNPNSFKSCIRPTWNLNGNLCNTIFSGVLKYR